ncbi:hypothetical protein ACQPYA_04030 [Micromonospora sp. CA-263727]|uniref:hypothetical protein n=1 Tax=Micromonospora sp. CA-263727 TaxID=3239967 RepID=UPI003D8D3D98
MTATLLAVTDAAGIAAAYQDPDSTRLHPTVWQALRDTGLTRSCLPRPLGGTGIAAPDLIDAIITLARVDANAGWAAGIHAPAGLFVSLLPPAAAQRIHADTDAGLLIGGSSQPAGTARPVAAGLRLTGRWPLVTGAHQISHAFLAATIHRTDAKPLVRWLCVPRHQLRVVDDWDAHGLRGTDSATIAVDDALVPAAHSIDLVTDVNGGTPLTRFPRFGLLAVCLAAVAVGVAEHSRDLFLDAAGRHQPRHAAGTLAEQPGAQIALAQASARLDAARTYLTDRVAAAWSAALTGPVPDRARVDLRLAATEATRSSGEVGRTLFDGAGSASVYRSSGLGDCLRDLDVITQHALLSTAGRQRAGQYLLTGDCPRDL